MKMIPNEKAYAEQCLAKTVIDRKPTRTLTILIKYFKNMGLTNEEIYNELVDHMTDAYDGFTEDDWRDKILDLIAIYTTEEHSLLDINAIHITESEMARIEEAKNEVLERILFVMLVYCKVKQAMRNHDSNWITEDMKEICGEAKVARSMEKQAELFRQLMQMGYFNMSRKIGSLSKELLYVDNTSPVAITITSFDDFILDYHIYKGKKVINCKECGKRVMVKGKARTHYCPQCKNKRELEQDRRYQQQKYKMSKNA